MARSVAAFENDRQVTFVEDKLSAKADEASHPFTISSPISVAKKR